MLFTTLLTLTLMSGAGDELDAILSEISEPVVWQIDGRAHITILATEEMAESQPIVEAQALLTLGETWGSYFCTERNTWGNCHSQRFRLTENLHEDNREIELSHRFGGFSRYSASGFVMLHVISVDKKYKELVIADFEIRNDPSALLIESARNGGEPARLGKLSWDSLIPYAVTKLSIRNRDERFLASRAIAYQAMVYTAKSDPFRAEPGSMKETILKLMVLCSMEKGESIFLDNRVPVVCADDWLMENLVKPEIGTMYSHNAFASAERHFQGDMFLTKVFFNPQTALHYMTLNPFTNENLRPSDYQERNNFVVVDYEKKSGRLSLLAYEFGKFHSLKPSIDNQPGAILALLKSHNLKREFVITNGFSVFPVDFNDDLEEAAAILDLFVNGETEKPRRSSLKEGFNVSKLSKPVLISEPKEEATIDSLKRLGNKLDQQGWKLVRLVMPDESWLVLRWTFWILLVLTLIEWRHEKRVKLWAAFLTHDPEFPIKKMNWTYWFFEPLRNLTAQIESLRNEKRLREERLASEARAIVAANEKAKLAKERAERKASLRIPTPTPKPMTAVTVTQEEVDALFKAVATSKGALIEEDSRREILDREVEHARSKKKLAQQKQILEHALELVGIVEPAQEQA